MGGGSAIQHDLRSTLFTLRRSRWPHGLRHRSAIARFLGLRVRISPGAWTLFLVSIVCCAGRDLYDGPIPRPSETHRLGVTMCVITCNNNPLHSMTGR